MKPRQRSLGRSGFGARARRGPVAGLAAILLAATVVCGCTQGDRALKYFGDAELRYYKEVATQVATPAVPDAGAPEARLTEPPRRIRHPSRDEIWDMPLTEAIHIALANSEVLRERGQFLSPGNLLLRNPEAATSVYDPAIQDTGFLFGARGVEAALADFDAQLITNMLFSRNEQVQNNLFLGGGLAPGEVLAENTASFISRVEKPLATGSTVGVSHNWNYSRDNLPARLFNSAYSGVLRADFRHPLWAASGTEFARIAGPVGGQIRNIAGVGQGVVIARINSDISIADFEANVRNLLKDVEDLYWELVLSYRVYDAEIIARNSAIETWRMVRTRFEEGLPGGSAAEEAQARDNYFEARSRAEDSLAELYGAEARLRRLIGLPVNDGRIIRPVDEPTTAEFVPDWGLSLAEALARRVELRRQKWHIRSLELQLVAARSLTRPQLDFVSAYQVNAFGDRLFGHNDDDGITQQGFRSAYETLTQGDQTGWNLGFEFSMPLGFRAARTQVRNLELRLAKARAGLAAQELEISHELAHAFQLIDRWYQTAQTNFNRRRAAETRVEAVLAEFEADGRATVDLVLRAQTSLAQAEIAYFRSIVEYNRALAEMHHRKGSLLEHNSVYLAEGEWDPAAYVEALRRAWHRSNAFHADHLLYSEPPEFDLGPPPTVPLHGTANEWGPLPPIGPPVHGPEPLPAYDDADAPTPVAPPAVPPGDPFALPPEEPAGAVDLRAPGAQDVFDVFDF